MCALGKDSKSDIRTTSCWKGPRSKDKLYFSNHSQIIPGPKYGNFQNSAFGNYNAKVRSQRKLRPDADYTEHVNKHKKRKHIIESQLMEKIQAKFNLKHSKRSISTIPPLQMVFTPSQMAQHLSSSIKYSYLKNLKNIKLRSP